MTCWPDDLLKVLDYQWNGSHPVLGGGGSARNGVKIALEMRGHECNNPGTALATGSHGRPSGRQLRPSHLFWQGIDRCRRCGLGNAIHHVHAKDTKVDPYHRFNGVLDTKPYSDEIMPGCSGRWIWHDLMF